MTKPPWRSALTPAAIMAVVFAVLTYFLGDEGVNLEWIGLGGVVFVAAFGLEYIDRRKNGSWSDGRGICEPTGATQVGPHDGGEAGGRRRTGEAPHMTKPLWRRALKQAVNGAVLFLAATYYLGDDGFLEWIGLGGFTFVLIFGLVYMDIRKEQLEN